MTRPMPIWPLWRGLRPQRGLGVAVSIVAAALTALAVTTAPLSAQISNLPAPHTPPSSGSSQTEDSSGSSQTQTAGWILTPSLAVSSGWDDNVFVEGTGGNTTSDLINVVNPRIGGGYTGRRGQLNIDYDGAFLLYRAMKALNSYDQHASTIGRWRLSKHVTLFANNSFAIVPTTETALLIGVPFVRTGSLLEGLQTGVETELTKRTSFSLAYEFQYVRFDQNAGFASQLHGGHGEGGTASIRHRWSGRTAFIADYRLQHANVTETNELFTVQTAMAGVEERLSESLSLVAEGGVAYLQTTVATTSQVGPSLRAGLTRRSHAFDVELTYGRSFVPSYGFGGTAQNEEVTANLHVPFTRRSYLQTAAAWRRNEPLTFGLPRLRSLWLESSIGYSFSPSVRVSAFYDGAHQEDNRPGGIVNRNRFGVQVEAAKPMRIH
jgi:hypothetical protein